MTRKVSGLFETMRAYRGKIVYFDGHLERIKKSCAKFNINPPCSFAQIKKQIINAVKQSRLNDVRVKLIICKAGNKRVISIIVKRYSPAPLQKYKSGFQIDIAGFKQKENSPLVIHKITDRQNYERAFEKAKKAGFDEALILNNRGDICEATRSNIFFVKGNLLFTPSVGCGCLPGITRKAIFNFAKRKKMKVRINRCSLQDLLTADEAFLTNSLIGVMPLAAISGKRLAKGAITKYFMNQYAGLLRK